MHITFESDIPADATQAEFAEILAMPEEELRAWFAADWGFDPDEITSILLEEAEDE